MTLGGSALLNAMANLSWTLERHTHGALRGVLPQGVIEDIRRVEDLIPMVVVVGDESSGKSSLLRALTSVSLPVGLQTTTRCRIELRMRQRDTERYSIYAINDLGQRHPSDRAEEEVAIYKVNEKVSEYQKTIENHLQHHQQGDTYLRTGLIVVSIEGPAQRNVTFVDLPGMRTTSTIPTQIVAEYLGRNNAFIVHIVNPTHGFANSSSVTLLRDNAVRFPVMNRMINVFTCLDRADLHQRDELRNMLIGFVNNIIPTSQRPFLTISVNAAEHGSVMSTEGESTALQTWAGMDRFEYGRGGIMTALENFTIQRTSDSAPLLRRNLNNLINAIVADFVTLGREPQAPEKIFIQWSENAKETAATVSAETTLTARSAELQRQIADTPVIVAANVIQMIQEDVLRLEAASGILPYSTSSIPLIERYCREALPRTNEHIVVWMQRLRAHIDTVAGHILDSGPESTRAAATEEVRPQVLRRIDNLSNTLLADIHGFVQDVSVCRLATNAHLFAEEVSNELRGQIYESARTYEANRIWIQTKAFWKWRMNEISVQIANRVAEFNRECCNTVINEINTYPDRHNGQFPHIAETNAQRARRAAYLDIERHVIELNLLLPMA